MVAALRLGGAADRRPAQANEEECRRAALARAVAFDPSLLVLEQPFDGVTARVAGELLEVARGGETAEGARRTILITGQEIPVVVQRRCDRLYRLTRAGSLELETV
jgi:ABC-type branched-subunit amino acid transport system ATPase component